MFEIVDSLCQRYNSLNPFIIWNTRAGEVFRLIRRIQRSNNFKDENNIENNNVQKITNKNSTNRINVTGKRGTGGWI